MLNVLLVHLSVGDVARSSGSWGGEATTIVASGRLTSGQTSAYGGVVKLAVDHLRSHSGKEQSSEAGEVDEVKRAARDYMDEDKGNRGSASLGALP
jgi:hypothetical protein